MSFHEPIRTRIKLRCSIQSRGLDHDVTHGFTEELARESLIIFVSRASCRIWPGETRLVITVDLPFPEKFRPRQLKCEASVSRVQELETGRRLYTRVDRMTITDRDQ